LESPTRARPCWQAGAFLLALLYMLASPAQADVMDACGGLDNSYGPWDYTNAAHRAQKIPIVDQYHFNADVENLIQGQSGSIMGDLDYTLRAVPNHHRALYSVAKYQLAGGKTEGFRTADCYFDRAMRFKPDDGMVYLVYGIYLQRRGKAAEAEQNYRRAVELAPDNAEVHYNVGLYYLGLKDYPLAREHAKRAYELGYTLPGLRRKLEQAGEWEEDADVAEAAGSH
jgi:tetratricopeptide (TPR) repeat protein